MRRDLRRRGRRCATRRSRAAGRRRLSRRYPIVLVLVRGRRARRRGRRLRSSRRRRSCRRRRMADLGLRMRRWRSGRRRMGRRWRSRVRRRRGHRRRRGMGRRSCGRSRTRRRRSRGRSRRWRRSHGRTGRRRCCSGWSCGCRRGLRWRPLRLRLSVGTEFFLGLRDDDRRRLRMRRGACELHHRQSRSGEQHETKVFHDD